MSKFNFKSTEDYKLQQTRDQHIYLDLTISNGDHFPIPAKYAEIRSSSVIENPEEYHLSVERFSIPAQMINLLNFGPGSQSIPSHSPSGSSNSITIFYTGVYQQTFLSLPTPVDYTGSTLQNSLPFGLNVSPLSISGTYLNFYQSFADSTNQAISAAENQIKNNCPTYNVDFTPFINYEPQTNLFRLNSPRQYNVLISNSPQLWMNAHLFTYYQSFQSIANNIQTQLNATGCDYRLKIKNNGGLVGGNQGIALIELPDLTGTQITGITQVQEFPTLYNFNDFKRIVMLTNDIPVTPTIISNLDQTNTILEPTRQVFNTFEVQGDAGFDIRSNLQFVLVGPRRYLDLQGNDPLRKLNIDIYWEDNAQNLIPIYIPAHDSINLLCQLTKKIKAV